jgi:hypothetical protein
VVKDDKKDVYQDSVTAPLSREHDDDAGDDAEGLEEHMAATGTLGEVLTAIPKVCSQMSSVRLKINSYLYVLAKKYHSGCAFKSPATRGMVRGSQCLLTKNSRRTQHGPRTCSYYAHPRCKDTVVLYPPNATYVFQLLLSCLTNVCS